MKSKSPNQLSLDLQCSPATVGKSDQGTDVQAELTPTATVLPICDFRNRLQNRRDQELLRAVSQRAAHLRAVMSRD